MADRRKTMKSSPPPPIDSDDPNNDVATGVKPFKPTPEPELRSGPASPPPMPMDKRGIKPFLPNKHDVIPKNGKGLASFPAGPNNTPPKLDRSSPNNTPPKLGRSSPIKIPEANYKRPVRQMEDNYGIKAFIPLSENKSSASPEVTSDNSYNQPESSLLSNFDFKTMPFDEKVNNFRGTPSRCSYKGSSPPSPPPTLPPRAAQVGGSLKLPPTHSHNLLNQSKNNNTRQMPSRNRYREKPRLLDTQFGEPVQPSHARGGSNSNGNASSSSSPKNSSDSGNNEESSAYNRRSGSYDDVGTRTGRLVTIQPLPIFRLENRRENFLQAFFGLLPERLCGQTPFSSSNQRGGKRSRRRPTDRQEMMLAWADPNASSHLV